MTLIWIYCLSKAYCLQHLLHQQIFNIQMSAQKQQITKNYRFCSLFKTIETKPGPIREKKVIRNTSQHMLYTSFFSSFSRNYFGFWWFRSRKLIHRSRTWTALFLKLSCPISLLHSSSPVHVHYRHYFHL